MIVEDLTGDGIVTYLGFGDSITYGVGDGTAVGDVVTEIPVTDGTKGYVPQVGSLTGVATVNGGIPGEIFTTAGVQRLPGAVQSSGADIVGIFEGSNDAIFRTAPGTYERLLQKALNVVRSIGRQAVIFTLPPPCCDHDGLQPFVNSFSEEVLKLSRINDVPVADIRRLWASTCQNQEECELYNLPEGLHPNSRGYKAIAQTVSAALLGIDIFSTQGQAEFIAATGITAEEVVVVPDVVTPVAQ
jgi:lysophospholipase L1-like esterase